MRRRNGFTLLEVMLALAIMMIGIAAIVSLQTMTARANRNSREMQIATEIIQNFAERLKADAMLWTDVNGLANTLWLRDINTVVNGWMPPANAVMGAPPMPTRSWQFDRHGRDVFPGDPGVFYCLGYRFNWVVPETPSGMAAIRADLIVYWPRENTGTDAACVLVAGGFIDNTTFMSTTMPIVVRRTILPEAP